MQRRSYNTNKHETFPTRRLLSDAPTVTQKEDASLYLSDDEHPIANSYAVIREWLDVWSRQPVRMQITKPGWLGWHVVIRFRPTQAGTLRWSSDVYYFELRVIGAFPDYPVCWDESSRTQQNAKLV